MQTPPPAPGHGGGEVDLLVCGSGAAGMTAALVAAQEGLQVMLCAKHRQVGGTAATSGGMAWIPGNHHRGQTRTWIAPQPGPTCCPSSATTRQPR